MNKPLSYANLWQAGLRETAAARCSASSAQLEKEFCFLKIIFFI